MEKKIMDYKNPPLDIPESYVPMYRRVHEKKDRRGAIKCFCLECCGWAREEVKKCTSKWCPLYPYRTGSWPKRNMKAKKGDHFSFDKVAKVAKNGKDEHGLTVKQRTIIKEGDGKSLKEVALMLATTTPSASILVNKLAKHGYVDRRENQIFVTDWGKKLYGEESQSPSAGQERTVSK